MLEPVFWLIVQQSYQKLEQVVYREGRPGSYVASYEISHQMRRSFYRVFVVVQRVHFQELESLDFYFYHIRVVQRILLSIELIGLCLTVHD